MTYCFLLIGASPDDPWGEVVKSASAALGRLQITHKGDALRMTGQHVYDLIIIDAGEVPEASELVHQICSRRPETKVVIVTTSPTWKRARDAFRAGAIDYVRKSMDARTISSTLSALIDKGPASQEMESGGTHVEATDSVYRQ